MPKNKILAKGTAKDTAHNFSYGHTQPIYTSINAECYRKFDLDPSVRKKLKITASTSCIGDQQRKTQEALQKIESKILPKAREVKNNSRTDRRQSCSTVETKKLLKNFRKTHFVFGKDNEFKKNPKTNRSPY